MHWRYRSYALLLVLIAAVLAITGLIAFGQLLVQPAQQSVGTPPASLNALSITIPYDHEQHSAAWFAPGLPGAGAVLLLHGLRSDRRQMLARAHDLAERGLAVLLIDLPAHGESGGANMQFGRADSLAVQAALHFLHQQLPDEKIGIIGVSLGAAATTLAMPESQAQASAVVLESMFATLQEAALHRMQTQFGSPLGRLLTPLLLWQLPLRFGFSAKDIRPIDQIAQLGAPVLIAAGTADLSTPWPETLRLFAAAAEPKQLWAVEGAGHVDLYDYDRAGYTAVVFPFLVQHLSQSTALPPTAR